MPAIPQLTSVAGGSLLSQVAALIGNAPSQAVIVQSPTASTSVSGPASFTQSPAATRAGTLLAWIVAVNSSAAAALGATPAGWTLAWSQVQATLALGIYVYGPAGAIPNPGGISSVTLASPTATAGGIAGVFLELLNCAATPDVTVNNQAATTAANSGGAGNAQAVSIGSNNLVVGAVAWVLGAATLTLNNLAPTAGWVNLAQVNSTNGTTNAALQVGYVQQGSTLASAAAGFRYGGTLSAGSAWNAGVSTFRTTASDQPVGIATGILLQGGDTLCATGPAVVGNG